MTKHFNRSDEHLIFIKRIGIYFFLILIFSSNASAQNEFNRLFPQIQTNSDNKALNFVSNTPPVEDARVRWRFRMDGQYSFVRPAIASDGTIYAVDVSGVLYALSPSGTLIWRLSGAGNKGVAVGADGAIYTASENDIKAINPNGTLRWQFNLKPRAFITLGIAVGPDGNIYSVAYESLGVFSLTPQGTLRWSTPEPYSRPIVEYGEIVFGQNGNQQQLYFYANGRIRGVRLTDGATVFPNTTTDQPFGQPVVSPLDNTVHANVSAYTPNGDLIWKLFNIFNSSIGFPAADVGADGVHYVVYPGARLYAVNPNGTIKYQKDFNESFGNPVVSPNNSILVIGTSTSGNTNSIVGFKASDGSENWRVTLPFENGLAQFTTTRARFTPDSRTAYVNTATADGQNSRSFIYAIDASQNNGNLAPRAVSSADRTAGAAPIRINFSSAGSFDPDGTIASYLWDFADGATSTEANPTHIFQTAGTYRVKLTVTDNLGATGETYLPIQFGSGGCAVNCARVTEIRMRPVRLPGNIKFIGRVRVQNENGTPLANAIVRVIWVIPGRPALSQTATADSEGYAQFSILNKKGTYSLNITLIEAAGLTYDEGNSVRTATITR